MNVVVIYGSTRKESNSKQIAKWLLEKYRPFVTITEYELLDENVPFFEDKRHLPVNCWKLPFPVQRILTSIQEAEAVVFVTPLYWYGMSGPMKNFFDWLTLPLFLDRKGFKASLANRAMFLVTVGSEDDLKAYDALQLQMRLIAEYLKMNLRKVYIAFADCFECIMKDEKYRAHAMAFPLFDDFGCSRIR